MGRKRKAEEKMFYCKKCGCKLSSLNKGSECFRHSGRETELNIWFPVRGSSSGPSGNSARVTRLLEYGKTD